MLSNASIHQWPVGGNGMFLAGRLGVSHIMYISRKDYLSRNNTSAPPDMVYNVYVPYRPIQLPFLSGRLEVMRVPHWPVRGLSYEADIGGALYGQILHIHLRSHFYTK